MTEILADMKAKGSGSLKNMKDGDEDEDGARGGGGGETREIWSDMRARGGDGEGEQRGNKECTMRRRY